MRPSLWDDVVEALSSRALDAFLSDMPAHVAVLDRSRSLVDEAMVESLFLRPVPVARATPLCGGAPAFYLTPPPLPLLARRGVTGCPGFAKICAYLGLLENDFWHLNLVLT